MELQLTETEHRLLHEILQEQHKHLLREIAKADHHEFKKSLRHRCDTLEEIMHKMHEPVHAMV